MKLLVDIIEGLLVLIGGAIIVLGAFGLLFAFILSLDVWVSYVATFYWRWFITPVFQIAQPALWQIFGLILCYRLITNKINEKDLEQRKVEGKEALSKIVKLYLAKFFGVGLLLFIGYLVHLLILR